MRAILLTVTLLTLAGCASTKKQSIPEAPGAPTPPAQIHATPPAASEPGKLSCSKGDDQRTIEVAASGEGCELKYTKAGKTASVASSSHGQKHCLRSQKKIREKLESAGFKCS